jgi:proteic killer suppression protein
VIRDFGDEATADIYHGENSRQARSIPQEIWSVARRKLDMLENAHDLRDLRAPPANRLELLKGTLAGFYSIRINDQYRVIFRFEGDTASSVRITDYHD